MPVFNIYEISPPADDENVNPNEPPRRVLAASAKEAVDLLQNALILGSCFRYMKLGEVPWLSDRMRCVAVEENVDNPGGKARILEN